MKNLGAMMVKLVVVAVCVVVLTIGAGTGLAEEPGSTTGGLREQLDEQVAATERLKQELADVKREFLGQADEKDPKEICPSEVITFVRDWQGTSCDNYQAQIAGWSSVCVPKCDEAARLQHATNSANATCAKFCRDRGCENFRYDPPTKCAVYRCDKHKKCPAVCPFLEECFLEQGNIRWNCMCIDL